VKPKTPLSRRDFLATSAVSATTVGMPYVLPSGILARPGRPGPNDRIVYGHIGIGGMGRSHVVADSCAALCDVDDNHLRDVAKNVKGNPQLVKDYRYVLDRKDIDAVTIGTPDHWHALMTVHACQAGKDVYSEKPTCRTIQEGRAMINAANRYKRVVQIGAQGRSNPQAQKACQFIRNGNLGKIYHVEVWHSNNWTGGWGREAEPPSNLDWNLWLGPARWRPYNPDICHFNFRWMMDFGGGFIRDRGNHVLSIVSWCMNADNAGPVSVEATGEPNPDGIWDVPVTMKVKWEFKDPDWTLTWVQDGQQHYGIEWGAKYHGDRDSLIVGGGDGGCFTESKARDYTPPAGGVVPYIDPDPSSDPTERHRQNWRRCIKTREKPVMSVEIGVRVITLAIIANISYQLGRKLRWDPKEERFIGDEEANRMLAEPYRAPWRL
jgi:predicted dehydrogenase